MVITHLLVMKQRPTLFIFLCFQKIALNIVFLDYKPDTHSFKTTTTTTILMIFGNEPYFVARMKLIKMCAFVEQSINDDILT